MEKTYTVGFRTIQCYDVTRSFDTTRTDSLRFRPVKIDLFYPATIQPEKPPLSYQFFLNLYGKRIDFRISADSCQKVGDDLAKYYSQGLGLDSATYLLRFPTQSYEAAPLATGSYPLILYCPGYNGMSYENVVLLEQLAAQGYWVAAISSVGKYPGYMTMDPVDVVEQVEDARFARRYLQRTVPVISERTAVLGYSWGGLAASIIGMQEPDIRAVVSLDGTERYTYGDDQTDDQQFTRIRQADYFRPVTLRAPYLYLSSGRENEDFQADSVFVLGSAISSPIRHYVRLPGTRHEDFSCLPYLAAQINPTNTQPLITYPLVGQLVTSWLNSYVKGQSSFFQDNLQQLLIQQPDRLALNPLVIDRQNRIPAFTLRGNITDEESKPLAYVNIGILKGSQGTVSQEDGSFNWHPSGANSADTIRLSLVGYESQDWPVSKLTETAKAGLLRVTLKRQVLILPEAVVRTKRPIRRTLGNATQSRFFSAGFGSDQLGAQMGVRVNARKSPMYIEKVDFHISYNRYDSLTIRLNIYQLENSVPTHNLMTRPVIVRLGKQTGRIAFDLGDQAIRINSDVVVAIELLNGQGGPERGVYLSAGMLNGSTYYRRASQGTWRQSKGVGAGIQVTVQY